MVARRAADASMTLLKEVMERPLDPGYAAAAAARAAEGADPVRRRRRVPVTVTLSVLAGLVLVTGVVQLRAPRAVDTAEQLREQITARTAEVKTREDSIVATDAEIAAAARRRAGRHRHRAAGAGAGARGARRHDRP